MSLVRQRIIRPSELDRYGAFARERLLAKPGITGLWQVSGRQAYPRGVDIKRVTATVARASARPMRVLVTGGAGFIGSNLVRLLCEVGHDVVVLDNLSSGCRELVDLRCRFIVGDLSDDEALQRAVRGVDVVMHLAASSTIARSISHPLEYVENNIVNGVRLLEAMRTYSVRQLVFSSTAAVYGEPVSIPVPESAEKSPLQPYGASKLAFETLLHAYHHSYGINSVSLRYFNAYGPGDLQEPVTRAVPRWVRAGLRNEPITLYWRGDHYRDYVFVDDVARAHLDVATVAGVHVYNVGSGDGILMRDLVIIIEEALDRPLRVIDGGERLGDPHRLVADISSIGRDVGWRPQTRLSDGIRKTVEFFSAHRDLWRRDRS